MGTGSTPRPTPGRRSRRISDAELTAWRAFLRAHAHVTLRLELDLTREHDLPLASYDVLVQLVEAPGRRLRMTDLAGAVLLSRSGLTRLVDRMERDGLVRRERVPGDARGVLAVLTDTGYARLRRASSTHLQGVADYVVDRLDPDELAALGRACEKLAQAASGASEPPGIRLDVDAAASRTTASGTTGAPAPSGAAVQRPTPGAR
jgi:DNA-binding MarR family transcriptional regulator